MKKVIIFAILFFQLFALSFSKTFDVEKYSIEQKISQMLILGFRGTSLDPDSKIFKFMKQYSVGGIVFFDKDIPTKKYIRNIENPKKLKKLIKHLNRLNKIKPFISIDQEGGNVSRLKRTKGFKNIPVFSQEFIGKINRKDFTYDFAKKTAKALKKLNINMVFAPCVDVNINKTSPIIGKLERSFSSDPKIVAFHSKILIDTYKKYNIIPVIKHFPGHGSSKHDSHVSITNTSKTYDRKKEIFPYKYLIDFDIVEAIMTAHIFNNNFDKNFPATMSKKTINFLKKNLIYDGLIISDDMMMKGITLKYSLKTSLEKAINAGVNIFIFSNNTNIYDDEIGYKIINSIKKSIEEKKIDIENINNSFKKIMEIKQKYKIL